MYGNIGFMLSVWMYGNIGFMLSVLDIDMVSFILLYDQCFVYLR